MSPSLSLHGRALALLQQALNRNDAAFRQGQWEAIEALVERHARILVVQRTGWGKSAVYFLSTRLLRERGAGPTLVVSPLLELMRDQINAANRLGVRATTLNSSNRDEWLTVERHLAANEIDVLFVSPERFANDEFLSDTLPLLGERVGLLVVDEAHCISDWGHDFRPDYRRIVRILERLPSNIPVCATTATANDRVVEDVVAQLGPNLQVFRGPLIRDSLRLQTVPLPGDGAKLGWLAHYIPLIKGSGIVYALTVAWTERIASWLARNNIQAASYSAHLDDTERIRRIQLLQANKIKVLVATTALGMGFDKPDISFVIHFHQPASVVHYYQQVGRAGRAIDCSYGFLLGGGDANEINNFFIENAFPTESEVITVLDALERSEEGLKPTELEAHVNLARSRIESTLKALAVSSPAPVTRLDGKWVRTAHPSDPIQRRTQVQRMTQLRRNEQAEMDAFMHHSGCLMEFLARALDDPAATPCFRCARCAGKPEASRKVPDTLVQQAVDFLRSEPMTIKPRAQWPIGVLPVHGWQGRIAAGYRAEPGRVLSLLGDPMWGPMIRKGKYGTSQFDLELVDGLVTLVKNWNPQPSVTWVTCVPSLDRPDLVPELARRLADRLGLPFQNSIRKVRRTRPQKEMENSWHQAHNLDGAFTIDAWSGIRGPALLVDDIVDSGWTFTILAALLRQAGCSAVFPLALASNR